MRPFATAAFAILAASTAAAAPAPAAAPAHSGPSSQSFLLYEVSNLYIYWSLGHVLETSFKVKEKNSDNVIVTCNAKAQSSITSPPRGEPLSGKCDSGDPFTSLSFSVGGSPGQNFLFWLNSTKSVACGPQREYEAKVSIGEQHDDCQSLEQNGNSAKCYQKQGDVIELQLNQYHEDPPSDLHRRDAQSEHRC